MVSLKPQDLGFGGYLFSQRSLLFNSTQNSPPSRVSLLPSFRWTSLFIYTVNFFMATVASSSDQAADLLQKLSLDSETKAATAYEYASKGLNGDNGSVMYHQNYSYPPYGVYPSTADGQMQGLQQYQYPSPYYHYAPNQVNSLQGGGSSSVSADKMSLSIETNKENTSAVANGTGVSGNTGSNPLRPSYQYSYLDPNSSHRRGGLSTVVPSPSYQDSGYSFDGIHSQFTWLDSSMYAGGQSKHATNAGFTSPISHSSNFSSGRNHNHRPVPHLMNLNHTRATGDTYDYTNQMYPSSAIYGHYGNTFRTGPGYGSFGYDSWISGRGWYAVDSKYKPRGRGYAASGSGKEYVDGLNELNKGPRAKGFKNQEGFDPITLVAKEKLVSTESGIEDNFPVISEKEKYSGEDFVETYLDAKFFVIKSYSEDDVHKSVKYNMWTSTPNGNKKLNAAYREAKEKSCDCPVLLLFSVNASGQFVGVAEMIGPVDFDKTVEYWQQDKWVGCFPLKWHIIKDVPNSSLRHITLVNNENKPVTNSRDTQEVNFEQGIQILKIFKSHASRRCILDDFGFYEVRERIMQQEKAKQPQLQKQVSDEKSSVVVDAKDKDLTLGKDRGQKSFDESLVKKVSITPSTSLDGTNGEAKKVEENGSSAAVDDSEKGGKAVGLSGKAVISNGAASAC